MTELLLIVIIALASGALVMTAVLIRRPNHDKSSAIMSRLDAMEKSQERLIRETREEFARNRQESADQGQGLRQSTARSQEFD